MPIKYALRQKTPVENIIRNNIGVIQNTYTYVPVGKDVAESHEDGVSAVFHVNGTQASKWLSIQRGQAALDKVKPKPPTSDMLDRMGEKLSYDDYVITSYGKDSLLIMARVISFTAQLVVIHDLYYNRIQKRAPELLLKVDANLYA